MSSLYKVPGPVKDLFDRFPVRQYPAVKQLTPDEKKEIQKRNYSYSVSSEVKGSHNLSFKLGTYNVFHTDDNKVLATDPLCLTAELSLAIKNNIKLPKLHNDRTDQNRNSLFLLSHHASEAGYLPIYIEEDSKRKSNRLIKDSQSINETLLAQVESSSELMLITLVDNVIYDHWITSILFEFSQETKKDIFLFSDSPVQDRINFWGLDNLLSQLLHRNGFDLRNPGITRQFLSNPYSILTKRLAKYTRAVEFERERSSEEFRHAIINLDSILSKRGSHFFNGGEKPGLLDLKVASYVTLVLKFGEGTDILGVVEEYPSLLEHSKLVLAYCS